MTSAQKVLGPTDFLICNAGASEPGYFHEQEVEVFERMASVVYEDIAFKGHILRRMSPGKNFLPDVTQQICADSDSTQLPRIPPCSQGGEILPEIKKER